MPYSMTDTVKVPNAAGRYILSWRWDCEQTYVFRLQNLSPVSVAAVFCLGCVAEERCCFCCAVCMSLLRCLPVLTGLRCGTRARTS